MDCLVIGTSKLTRIKPYLKGRERKGNSSLIKGVDFNSIQLISPSHYNNQQKTQRNGKEKKGKEIKS